MASGARAFGARARGRRRRAGRPAELFAACTMALPSAVACAYCFRAPSRAVLVASAGCVAHFPFSAALHVFKAFADDPVVRTRLYKLDVAFVHLHALLTGYSWALLPRLEEVVFHAGCVAHVALADPLATPRVKTRVDALVAGGVLKSAFGMFSYDARVWGVAHAFWALALWVHNKRPGGTLSPGVVHALLTIPQFCLLCSLAGIHTAADV